MRPLVLAGMAVLAASCVRYGNLGTGPGTTLAHDAQRLAPNDPASVGPNDVIAVGLDVPHEFPVVLYRPRTLAVRAPGVVFLPGQMATDDEYESYARALASHGFVVAVRAWYDPFRTDTQLAHDATVLYDWLERSGLVDPSRVGIAGHSMGGKDAIWAAVDDPRFRAVIAIDPDDQGHGHVSVVHGRVERVRAPLLLIGAEVAWRGWQICAPKATNYQRFFEHAPPGTIELTLRDADHVQVMDRPDRLGYQICRVGTANSFLVRTLARRATVAFFTEHLAHGPAMPREFGAGASVRVRESAATPATR